MNHAYYEVIPAPTEERVFAELDKKSAALAVLAQNQPSAHSLELLRMIKAQWPAVPIILLVENLDSDLILAAFRAGASDVIKKPLVEEDVRIALRRILPPTAPARAQGLKHTYTRFKKLFTSPTPTTEKLNPSVSPLPSTETRLCEEAGETVPPRVRAYYFGKFRVLVNDHEAEHWSCRKSKLLFADLLMNHRRRSSREVLMETFWPSAEANSARNSLNVALHHIRRALHEVLPGYDFILFKDDCYFLNPDLEVWLDLEEFKEHWKKAQGLEREQGREAAVPEFECAAETYLGDFMEEDLYDGWATSQREHFREIYLATLDRISKTYSLNGKPGLAVDLCEKILARDNCREDVHRRLMLCYYRLDKRDKALKQFKKCEEILQAELEVKPTRATVELHEKIKNGDSMKKR